MIPQKAMHMHIEAEKKRPKYLNNPYAIMEKYDGWYGYMDSNGEICSRSMRPIPSLENLSKELKFPEGRLIFEIMIDGVDFHTLNGLLNRTVNDCTNDDAYLIVHDFIPRGRLDMMFMERYCTAIGVVNLINHQRVEMAPIITISKDPADWKNEAEDQWVKGKEGVILKRIDAPYSPGKRNHDLMKIKEELTVDLAVVGMERGEGKYSNTLGSLICKSKSGAVINVSGMTDQQRDYWWIYGDEIIGKVVEVRAMKQLPDGTLREPRFKSVRFDKTVTDLD